MFTDLVDIDELESYDETEADEELIDEEAKKVKFRLLGPLGKAHNIVVYIHGLADRTKEFRTLTGRLILIDNHIRWCDGSTVT